MKRPFLLLLSFFVLGTFSTVQAQDNDLMDYVDEVRGDTLVIKNSSDFEEDNVANSLPNAIEADSIDRPDGRVYMLKRGTEGGYSAYTFNGQYTIPEGRNIVRIVGEDAGPVVQGTAEDGSPPLIVGTGPSGEATNGDYLNAATDLTLKNLAAMPAATDGSVGYALTDITGEGNTVTFDNVLMEHNRWVFVQANNGVNGSLFITDSYFVNATDLETRRNGGVYDSVNEPLDTLWVENTTHVQMAGMQYKFRNFPANKAFINHNTFVNATGQLFTSFGYETNFTVTNNLFVNSNIQAYWPGLDGGETDQDNLPHGIINLNHLPDGIDVADEDRKVLVDKNGVYWDDRLDDIIQTLEDEGTDGSVCESAGCLEEGQWMTQMITANSRTQDIFDNEDRYPRITEGEWIQEGAPNFQELPDMVPALIDWSVATVNSENTVLLEKLRTEGNQTVTGEVENTLTFDWPVAVDLSYTNQAYLDGGLGGYPVGDLNWFPDEKDDWEAEQDDLYDQLQTALDQGTALAVKPIGGAVPSSSQLKQNYPNPFTAEDPTQVEFSLSQNADVRLEVYDVTGRRVAVLVDKRLTAGNYTVAWDGTNQSGQAVSSGAYFYSLKTGQRRVETKQMVIVK